MNKTGIVSIARVRALSEKETEVVMTFSESIMASTLDSVAKRMGMPVNFTSESYITFTFDLTKTKKENICDLCRKFLGDLDEEVARVKPLQKSLLGATE